MQSVVLDGNRVASIMPPHSQGAPTSDPTAMNKALTQSRSCKQVLLFLHGSQKK